MAARGSARGHLFRKYVVVIVTLVGGTLLTSGLVEIYFSYQENKAALVAVQREKALGVAAKIEQFIREIERQVGWTSQAPWTAGAVTIEQRRFDSLRLLRQVPAITEVSHLDPSGREQLRVSRLAMDVVGSQQDFSRDPKFTRAKASRIYLSPVYFRKESEPYLTLALAGSGPDAGVTAAEVNLKFIWDVISRLKIGKEGQAYVVDSGGSLIAHPDISLVLKHTDLTALPQVQAARAEAPGPGEERVAVVIARSLQDREVLTAHAPIEPLGWLVFVEQPVKEALEPLFASIYRTVVLLLGGLALAIVASLVLARRLVTPIRALQAGAARIGAGELEHRLAVRSGDEVEALADEFNRMTERLQESHANLEEKVEARTRELSESLEQQTATGDILRVIASSPTDIQPVLDAVAENAARLCGASDAIVFRVAEDMLEPVAFYGPIGTDPARVSRGFVSGRSVIERRTVHVHDLAAEVDEFPDVRDRRDRTGVRTVLATPLLREGGAIGSILIRRLEVRPFTDNQIKLLETFADQAVIAIENVRLFQELQARTRELARSVDELQALGEVGRAVSSTLDLETVLTTIVGRAVPLAEASGGSIYEFDAANQEFHLRTTHLM
ncbi:MAG: GAF domain-containing protein, partial [Candidatus Rokuibacteriota bacterium]